MANWRDEYSAALAVRDRREKANVPLYNACKAYSSSHDITERPFSVKSMTGMLF